MSDEARVVVTGPAGERQLELPWTATVEELFEQARPLVGAQGAGYEIWCADGVTMMNKLERTLGELRDRRICPRREFQIRRSDDARSQ